MLACYHLNHYTQWNVLFERTGGAVEITDGLHTVKKALAADSREQTAPTSNKQDGYVIGTKWLMGLDSLR